MNTRPRIINEHGMFVYTDRAKNGNICRKNCKEGCKYCQYQGRHYGDGKETYCMGFPISTFENLRQKMIELCPVTNLTKE